ncbi:UPF0235 protein C15orf40-like isoform F [Glycine soja]|uniref:UPF0235 protein C15orf40-like isoform F n=1 Tax=Glycine soja TaxID=3848 RepID=A0A445KA10_GLYSO|nr:UPF0235 protein C15orf40-like isoform F [Glycine soja]
MSVKYCSDPTQWSSLRTAFGSEIMSIIIFSVRYISSLLSEKFFSLLVRVLHFLSYFPTKSLNFNFRNQTLNR